VVPEQARDQGTRSPIELFWTAKYVSAHKNLEQVTWSGHEPALEAILDAVTSRSTDRAYIPRALVVWQVVGSHADGAGRHHSVSWVSLGRK